MSKRTDIKKILIIGSGPIVIGQACEFDYSGTQACRALREEGYEVVLINSNPATIMTDPATADRTYIEPITPETVIKILDIERPDAILPTLGGQTGLNTTLEVAKTGVLEKLGIELIGANRDTICRAEDRELFKKTMIEAGLDLPKSGYARNLGEAWEVAEEIGFPLIIRPSYTLGGTGGGTAETKKDFEKIVEAGLSASPAHEVLIEESLIGWKEFELEVMRDKKDNVVIVCSIENLDPMGIHTGDSITVAPIQTLTDREYQILRDQSITIIRAIGVETGGCNIQFAQNPETGRIVVIEMNPRVSRSSALASKATGFPIAKIAAKLAVGYTLDEIRNDITRETPASFEPMLDYCVVKIPRFNFEKFPGADSTLTISMKSVGEVMAIGRTFKEALQKGLRSLERGRMGFGADGKEFEKLSGKVLKERLKTPNADRLFYIHYALKNGMTIDEIFSLTKIDRWFLDNMSEIAEEEKKLSGRKLKSLSRDEIFAAKQLGFSDVQLGHLLKSTEQKIRKERKEKKIKPVYKLVDTCAAEFEAYTPYYYSTYDEESEARPDKTKKIMILGGGPNRIGQGIEFDYCCVHASMAIREMGLTSIMVNCNPETVSTDYDTSDKLYFEPLTVEDVTAIIDVEKPAGVIVQFGGQTPLNISSALKKEGAKILGTSVASIADAEDRKKFSAMLKKINLKQTPSGTTFKLGDAKKIAGKIGFPVLMRPSFVLGGAKMEIVYDKKGIGKYWKELLEYCGKADVQISRSRPILIDKFLEDATEVDVDAVCDGRRTYIAGIMEHIEAAGIHSGDSACILPSQSLSKEVIDEISCATKNLAKELKVLGLMNVQYAIKGGEVFILEVNPRASRTVPFVSKATGLQIAKIATKVMLGKTLDELGVPDAPSPKLINVKEAVLPFNRFPGAEVVLKPEMLSTGEVMGIADKFGRAFAKSQIAAGQTIPLKGTVFISAKDSDKQAILSVAKELQNMGFKIIATRGTSKFLKNNGVQNTQVNKVWEGKPNIMDVILNGGVDLVLNTPLTRKSRVDEGLIRRIAVMNKIPLVTTTAGASALIKAIRDMREKPLDVRCLQD